MESNILRIAVALLSIGVSLVAQGPVPRNSNVKPAGFHAAKPPRSDAINDAAALLQTQLFILVTWPFGEISLSTDGIADKWALIAKLSQKMENRTIGIAPRPKWKYSYSSTYPNRITVVGTPPAIVGVYDGNDTGNAIALWDDQWNPDGTFKVPDVGQQSKDLSVVWLASIIFHELVHADEHAYTPGVIRAGNHWDIYTGQAWMISSLADLKGLTGQAAKDASNRADKVKPSDSRSYWVNAATARGETQEIPPN